MPMKNESYHRPVMSQEAIEALAIEPSGSYADATFGGGGHAEKILEGLGDQGLLVAFDRDEEVPLERFSEDPRFRFIRADFRYIKNWLRYYGILPLNGLLADLGVSSHHFDTAERGFSIRYEGPLDMRMDPQADLDAAKILREYSMEALSKLFKVYGELHQGKKLARRIVEKREEAPLESSTDLRRLAEPLFPPTKKESSLARVFQALRIEVNGELEALEELLKCTPDLLEEGGRMVFLTYHSLEDRLVKRFIQHGNFSGEPIKDEKGRVQRPFRPVHRKPLTPSEAEIDKNPRARSAKLRAAERIEP